MPNITRADQVAKLTNNIQFFSDFTDGFYKHPITNELAILKDADSVRQSVKNLILTNLGERPFNPFIGSNVNSSLFEPFTPFLIEDITRYINDTIKNFEPRALVLNVQITDNTDINGMIVNITFVVINNPTVPITLNLLLRRAR